MAKDLRLRITTAENGGMVMYPMADAPIPAARAGEVRVQPPLYIVPKVDAKAIGETVLTIMATKAMQAQDMDIEDIEF